MPAETTSGLDSRTTPPVRWPRAQTNGTYDYPIGVVNQSYTRNGLNQYTQVVGTNGGTLGWDANGNLTSDGLPTPTSYTYDTENRLTSATCAKTATLTYDPVGRLHQVSNAAGTTRFLCDGDRLILEYNASGAVQRRYVHGAPVPARGPPGLHRRDRQRGRDQARYRHLRRVRRDDRAEHVEIPVHGADRNPAGRAVLLQGAVLQPEPRKVHADGPDRVRR